MKQMNKCISALIILFFLTLLLSACDHHNSNNDGTAQTVVVEGDAPLTINHLEAFYAKENFEIDAKTNRPEPSEPSERLYKYVEDNYKDNFRVRRVLTNYFLDFHAACLEKRILNYKTEGKNLAEFFVDKEFGKDKNFLRSPSFDYIFSKVANRNQWLSIDKEGQKKLARNQSLHLRYLESATR